MIPLADKGSQGPPAADSIDDWAPSFIDALAGHGRVIAMDYEGIGRTILRPGTITIPRLADDTATFIVSLHLKQPGSSMGGQVDQALAVKYPRLVKRLILAATAPGDGKAIPREVSGPAPYRFAAAIPHLELKIDPDAAHGFLVQHITAWVRQFDRFLS
jgi:pimeloyl-ACP methyl ester carboxylesterase